MSSNVKKLAVYPKVAGVVLAGGKSSRMGTNKIFLTFKGHTLFEHMLNKLKNLGLTERYVSGDIPGKVCIRDFSLHQGPAAAINNVCQHVFAHSDCHGILILPVDMPLLTTDLLKVLIASAKGSHFHNYPLPLFIRKIDYLNSNAQSVNQLIVDWRLQSIALPENSEIYMTNTNTPEQWQKALDYELKN